MACSGVGLLGEQMRLAVRSRASRGESGASAVEFALLLPIFVMLTFGTLTGGIAFWHHIELTQGARDAARLGATFPISTVPLSEPCEDQRAEKTIDCWLTMVAEVAATESGWGSLADVNDPDSGAVICVAYVAGPGDTISTKNAIAGEKQSDNLPSDNSAPCFKDDQPESRVQVFVRRDAEFNAVLFNSDLELRTRSSIPYERRDTT